ncbi:hypothetical protein G3I60_04425 [Streptomyces sp. SID13666]|uniref:hypothetical protein n=1 Tax=unclassified Streptomyces TaxID=2593676 RepID=UPI0013BF47B4|nr:MULTISPECIES: hypothetical protein [unclassified Streptomyces]NEA53426.1 hypothetical protein [Streptomyces sp. SID13666]NEA69249.1 hypothetical protein [Streptomyces sp. SID13588]
MTHSFDSAETFFQDGCQLLRNDAESRGRAERYFEAAAHADPEIAWRVASEWAAVADGRAAPWLRRAITSLPTRAGITVAPGTLSIVTEHGFAVHQIWRITVAADDRIRAVAALESARPRLMRTTDSGQELTATAFEAALAHVHFYSPNNVTVHDKRTGDPVIQLNCKDAILPLMARTVICIITDELARAGVTASLSTPTEPA